MQALPLLASIVIQYQALAAPVLVPVPASTAGGGVTARTGTIPIVQYQAHAAPVVVPSQVVTPVTGASPVYPAQVFRKPSTHASRQQAFWSDSEVVPATVTAPDLAVTQDARRFLPRQYRHACYVMPPEFGVPTQVPVMAWTAHLPIRLPHWTRTRHARHIQTLAWDTVLGPLVVVAPDQAVPVYPDTVRARPRVVQFPQPSWPPFVADVTVAPPPSAWEPEYVERVRPRHSILTAQQQAFAFWPFPVPAIAVSHLTGGRGYWTVRPHKKTFVVTPHRKHWVV